MAEQLDSLKLLASDLAAHSPRALTAAGKSTAALVERCHFALGRLIAHVHANPRPFGYVSGIDFAEAELGMRERTAYHLLEVERATRALPHLRDVYEGGKASFSNVREAVKVATADDDGKWAELAQELTYRALYKKVHDDGDARAARGEGPWPDSGLHGEVGRPEPTTNETRPMTPSLRNSEREVWEMHSRWAGQDTGWREFYEATLVSYRAELERLLAETVPAEARFVLERDGWRCVVPGCSRRANLQRHHVMHRSQGGSDFAANLVTLCFGHHEAHHQGLLDVRGDAERGFRFRHRETPGAEWQSYPAGASCGYDPVERAWDGPSYVREASDAGGLYARTSDHAFNPYVTERRKTSLSFSRSGSASRAPS